jgi:Flp pilus assembly protein TadG
MPSFATLRRNDKGSALPIFGLLLVPIFAAVALAVDYGAVVAARSKLQAAVDSAALSGATQSMLAQASTASALAEAQTTSYFASVFPTLNIPGALISSAVVPSSDGSDVTASAVVRYQTKFGVVIGRDTFDIAVQATARRPDGAVVLDVAMCIDATGSMQPTLNAVKASALSFYADLNIALAAKNMRPFDAVRLRPIYFRDFGGNAGRYSVASGGQVDKYPSGWLTRPAGDARNLGDDVPMRAAPDFFNMFDKAADFDQFVSSELESGGGDNPESGLECLNEAISSPWLRTGNTVKTALGDKTATSVYSVIAHWTDNDAQPPSYAPSLQNPNYPPAVKMPRDYAGLTAKWNDDAVIPQSNKLLAFFTPLSASDTNYLPVKAWDRFQQAGTLADGTDQMIASIATALSKMPAGVGTVRLMN